jgi:hypothetical protein
MAASLDHNIPGSGAGAEDGASKNTINQASMRDPSPNRRA